MKHDTIHIAGEGEFKLRKRTWGAVVVQSVFLMGLWLLLSGRYDLFHIALGVFSVVVISVWNLRIHQIQFFSGDVPEWERIQYLRVLTYIPWLVWQIILASLQVAYVVLHPKMPVKPRLLRFKAKLPNVGARVILGNSITITPGTITVEIRGEEYLVHALTEDSAGSLVDGTMPARVARLFRKSVGQLVSDVEIIKSETAR